MEDQTKIQLYNELKGVHERLEILLHRYRVTRRQLGRKRKFGTPKQKTKAQLEADLEAITTEIGDKREKKRNILREIDL